jgi:paraquat-inducible protein A
MIDIFMESILVALVQFGTVASVYPGGGAVAFAAVVILTMLSAHSFDPRLMWDNLRRDPASVATGSPSPGSAAFGAPSAAAAPAAAE